MAARVPRKGATRASPQHTSAPKESSADIARPRRQSTASFSVRTGADRVIHVFPGGTTSSGGSVSVRSPVSSGGSLSPSSEDSWSDLGEDDIDPSDSASRSRGPPPRRPTVEAPRPPPATRHSSRRAHREREREERSPPRRQSSRHHSRHESRHDSRHERSSSRRVHSDGSSSTETVADDYPPYGHHGMPRAQYSAYRHVPVGSHGGYPPTMASGPSAGYPDPYQDPRQALVATRHDAFGCPGQPNPFAQHAAQQNPFSPMPSESLGYFTGAPEPPIGHMGPPPGPQRHPSEVDMHGRRPRPQSYAGPSPYGPPDQAMMPYQAPGFPPYGVPYGMPGYPMFPPMHAYPSPPPAAPAASPPPKEPEKNKDLEVLKEMLTEKKKEDTKDKSAKSEEIAMLKDLIKKHEEERAAREKAWVAEREAEAAAKAAAIAKAEEERKRKEEIADASKKAKEAAEKKAEEAAKKAAEEAEKKLNEATKKAEDTEKAKKELEEAMEKAKPTPDSQKAPIRFKDAVGRKFSFPWAICKTWKGMETLIKQAFLHVDMIGDHVHQGHYDLTGPDGEIILPQIWDSMIQPDWEVTMHLWPMEEEKKPPKDDPIMSLNDPFAGFGISGGWDLPPEPGKKAKKGKDVGKKSSKKPGSPETMVMFPGDRMPPPPPPGVMMPPPPPPGPGGSYGDPFAGMMPPGISSVMDKPAKNKTKVRSKSVRGKEISPLTAWFAGGNINATRPKKR